MNRGDLESKLVASWEPASDSPFLRCTVSLPLNVSGYLALGQPPEAKAAMEVATRRSFAFALLGDLEAENQRLRAAVKKWGRRAICRQFPSRERRDEQDGEEKELKEDLK